MKNFLTYMLIFSINTNLYANLYSDSNYKYSQDILKSLRDIEIRNQQFKKNCYLKYNQLVLKYNKLSKIYKNIDNSNINNVTIFNTNLNKLKTNVEEYTKQCVYY